MAAPLICMTLTGRSIEENINLVRKYAKYCDIVELRADYLEEDEQLLIRKFPALINKPCILTIRRSSDGGQTFLEEPLPLRIRIRNAILPT